MNVEKFPLPKNFSATALFAVARERFGAPGALLESGLTDDQNQFSLLAFCPIQEVVTHKDTFRTVRSALKKCHAFPEHFPFSGGLIGYFNFEIFDEIEPPLTSNSQILTSKPPRALFYEFSRFFAIDHAAQAIFAIDTTGQVADFSTENFQLLAAATTQDEASMSVTAMNDEKYLNFDSFISEQTEDHYTSQVKAAQQKILNGEIFQMILSNGWKKDVGNTDGLAFYRGLRALEPTTHLVFYDFGERGQVGGASPEILGRKRGQTLTYSPIAGTRYRGENDTEDQRILAEMANDSKENAEHDMLVDLGRNDLGKVCKTGSIKVTKEKYGRFFANVMHLVSDITGELKPGLDAIDFFQAIFPAGTLSGAPKIRAMELIRQFEPSPRKLYGGAIGYFSVDGDMEFCIAIRSFFLHNDVVRFRCGAGVVQDSVPALEWKECHNKARSLCKVINYILSSKL